MRIITTYPWLRSSCKGLALLCMLLTMVCSPAPAHAAPLDLNTCAAAGNFGPNALTAPIVYCVKTVVINAVDTTLQKVTDYMHDTLTIIFVFAVITFSLKIVAGETELNAKTMGFLLRVGLVWYFATNLAGFADDVFYLMDQMIGLVVAHIGDTNCEGNAWEINGWVDQGTCYLYYGAQIWSPWDQIDSFLGKILGFAPGLTLMNGIIGIVAAALFSGTTGVTLFASGIVALFDMFLFVLDVIYAYLSAVMVVAFMIIISPMIIPLALFQQSERYFKKWLDTIIAAILVPVFLFGFLSMTLGVFTTLVQDILLTVDPTGNANFSAFWRVNVPVFGMMMPTDRNFTNDIWNALGNGSANINAQLIPPVQNVVNPFGREAFNPNNLNFFGVNFGDEDQQTKQNIIFSFISLLIYAYIMKSMIRKMPEIASSIAGAVTGITIQSMSFKNKVNEAMQDAKTGFGSMVGGVAGSEIGAGLSGRAGRSLGTTLGGLGGALIGRRL